MRQWLIELRKDKGLTQEAMAEMLGVTQPSIGLWESGQRTPKPQVAKKVAEILGFDWTKFYEA